MKPFVAPVVATVLGAMAVQHWRLTPSFTTPAEWSQFGGTLASIAVTMLGFMLASLAVVASINHTQLVSQMRRTGHYSDLLAALFQSAAFFLACALLGFALLFGAPAQPYFATLAVAFHVGALVTLMDVGRKFWLVLSNLGQ